MDLAAVAKRLFDLPRQINGTGGRAHARTHAAIILRFALCNVPKVCAFFTVSAQWLISLIYAGGTDFSCEHAGEPSC